MFQSIHYTHVLMATFIEMLLDEVIYDHSRRDFIQNARKYYLKIWFI